MECSGSDGGEWVWVRLPTQAEAAEQQKSPSAAATEVEDEERALKVVFASPAEYFTDAAPIGNGSLGGMVWGGVATEKLQLNRN
jgi:alpha-L-fucosidase 2